MTAVDRDLTGQLGPVRSRHDVDNDRRLRIGGWSLALGVLGGLISAIMLSSEQDPGPYQPSQGQAQGAVYGLTLCALVIGLIYLWKSLSRGDEYFEVREHGLVHATRWSIRTYPWEQIAYIRVRKGKRADPIGHYFGTQYWAAITLRNRRRKLKFNGLTDRYQTLTAAILANCSPAPRKTLRQRLMWLGVGLASAAAFPYLINYVVTHPEGVSDTTVFLLVAGLLGSAILAFTALILFWRKD